MHLGSYQLVPGVVQVFGSCDAELPFLPDHQIPKDFKDHIESVSQQQVSATAKSSCMQNVYLGQRSSMGVGHFSACHVTTGMQWQETA